MLSTWTPIQLYLLAMFLSGVAGSVKYLDENSAPRPLQALYKFILHGLAGGVIGGVGHEWVWTSKPATVVFSGAGYALGIIFGPGVWDHIRNAMGGPK